MIIGIKKENFDYFKHQVYRGKVKSDKLFAFFKLKKGKSEYRSRDNRSYSDATFEPSEVKEILTLSTGITLLDITRHRWKKAPIGYSFPEDLEGYVDAREAIRRASPSDKLFLEGINLL